MKRWCPLQFTLPQRQLRALVGMLAAALVVLAVSPPSLPRAAALALLSGALPVLLMRRTWRLTELLAACVPMSILLWGLAAPALYALGAGGLMAWLPAVVALAAAPFLLLRPGRFAVRIDAGDLAATAFTAILAIPVMLVWLSNGPMCEAAGVIWRAREWVGGDTLYLFALAEMAAAQKGLPAECPFMAGVANWYPALIHTGLGGMAQVGGCMAAALHWTLAPVYILSTAALLAHAMLRRSCWRRGARSLVLGMAAALAVVLLRIDHFVFLQAQVLAMGVLFLGLWLTGPRPSRTPALPLAAACVAGIFLAAAHTVSGVMAVALMAADAMWALRSRRGGMRACVLFAAATAGAVLWFRVNDVPFPPERAPQGFCARALPVLVECIVPWLLPLAGVFLAASTAGRRAARHLAAGTLLAAMGAAATFQGTRLFQSFECWFAVFNSQRAYQLAMLALLPAFFGMRFLNGRAMGTVRCACLVGGLGVLAASFVLTPNPTTIASKELVVGKTVPVTVGQMECYDWVRANTPPRARVMTDLPQNHLPGFTGRAEYLRELAGFYGLSALSPSDRAMIYREGQRFFHPGAPPGQRTRFLERRGIGYVVLAGPWENEDAQHRAVAERFLPGSMKTVFANKDVLVLKRMER